MNLCCDYSHCQTRFPTMAAEFLSLRRFFKTLKLFKIPDKYFSWLTIFGQQKYVRTCTRIPLPLAFNFLRFGGAWKKKARTLKGTVPRDFRLQVVLWNQFPPSPWISHEGRFEFFRKFAEIFWAQGAPPAANLPPVSLLLGVRISLRIFEKILNDPNVIFRGLGEDEPWKNWK